MTAPTYTADVVALSTGPDGARRVLLIQRGWPPYEGLWALPGGYLDSDRDTGASETPAQAAVRELREETGIQVDLERLRELGVWDTPGRDPRGPVVTTAFSVELDPAPEPVAGDDAAAARWWPLDALPKLAFDHGDIVGVAVTQEVTR